MAKEAIALVIDLRVNSSCDAAAFEGAKHCASKLLVRKILSESRDQVCLVLCGASGEELVSELGNVSWSLVDHVQALKKVEDEAGDDQLFGCIRVAFEHLKTVTCGRRDIGVKSIAVFSHAQHQIEQQSRAEVEQLANELNENQCGLNWIHPEETANATVSMFVSSVTDGCALKQQDVIGMVKRFQTRQPRATAWKAQLEIGTTENRKRVCIPVCGYLKIREAKQKTMQTVLASNPDVVVKNERTFFKSETSNEAADEVKQEDDTRPAASAKGAVDASEIEFAYRFGRDLVVIGDAEYRNMKYRVPSKCLQLLKVVPRRCLPLSQLSGDGGSMIIVGDTASSEAQQAVSALVCALNDADACVIARKCYSAASTPRLFVLEPRRSRKMDKLVCIGLPFADDFRSFHFESLPLDDQVLHEKPYLKKLAPSDSQRQAIDQLVRENVRFTQQNEAVLDFNSLQNPYLQRFLEACESKATSTSPPANHNQNRDEAEALLDGGVHNTAWRSLFEKAAEFSTLKHDLVAQVREAFDLQRVASKKFYEKPTGYAMFLGRVEPQVQSQTQEMQVDDAQLQQQANPQVGSVSAVQDFLKLAHAQQDELIVKGFAAMRSRIEEFLADEFAQPYFPKIVECLGVLRSESIAADVDFEQCRLFNEFLLRLKQHVLEASGLREFWQLAREAKLSLITQADAPNITGYSLPAEKDSLTLLYDVLDKEMDIDLTAAHKQHQIEMEDDFDPFAEVQWNC